MGKDALPAIAEEGGRFRRGADLVEGADGPERGVPEFRFARRWATMWADVHVGIWELVIAGRGAVVDRACRDAEVEVFRPQPGGARLIAGDFRREAAHCQRTDAVPLRQQAGGILLYHERLVRV